MVVAEITITPVVGDALRPYIDAAVDEVRKSGLNYEVEAMGTTVEGELDQVLEVVKKAHEAVRNKGAQRVLTEVKIDDRVGGVTMKEELQDYRSSV